MNWAWFNRAIFFLGLVALFISTTIFVSHQLEVQLPCTNAAGCAKVANSKYASVAGIPTAAFGMVFDIGVIGYCMFRPRFDDEKVRRSSLLFWFACVVAFLISTYLIVISNTEVKALCEWCVAHAIVMGLLLIVAAIEQTRLTAAETLTGPRPRERFLLGMALIGGVVVTTGYGGYLKTQPLPRGTVVTVEYKPSIEGTDPWSVGSANAPLTIVEFGDFECEHCGRASRLLKGLFEKNPKNVRLIFRHCPLFTIHHNALNMAIASEWAGQKGRFWQMHDAVFENQGPVKQGKFLSYATAAGLDPTEMQKFLSEDVKDKKSAKYKAFMRVYADYKDAQLLKVDSTTPTIYVVINNPGRSQVNYMTQTVGGLKGVLDRGDVQRWLVPNSY